ncbi:hypothetical protein [Fusibacter sp. JL216-2]|uniref:hypothetical protein n=1 Tax=Fusibacter sp. JL216-2 TaxID=3071453 RepID=UPI003D32C8BA
MDTKSMSKFGFFISSITGLVLLISSAYVLFQSEIVRAPIRDISIVPLGKTMYLLFWAVIGWGLVDALSHLVRGLSLEGYFPRILNRKNKSQVPINAVLNFVSLHIVIIILSYSEIINIEGIVNTAIGSGIRTF